MKKKWTSTWIEAISCVKFCNEEAKEGERRMRDEWQLLDSEKTKTARRDIVQYFLIF